LNKTAPIVLFVYNRPEHTRRTVESLLKNNLSGNSSVFIFSDGPKSDSDSLKIKSVREYVKSIKGFENIEIKSRDKNIGLANSVISGMNEILSFNESIIAMEDDLITSPSFLSFMNNALAFYHADKRIFSVSGYPYPIQVPKSYLQDIFISYRASSWGWGTWKDRWEKVDWEVRDFNNFISDKPTQKLFSRAGEDLTPMLKSQMKGDVDSWAIRWSYAHFKQNAFCLYPVVPLCKNIGTDKSGTHSASSDKLDVEVNVSKSTFQMEINPQLNDYIVNQTQKLFKLSLYRKFINHFKYS
jgi:hypothetical protein